MRASTVEYFGWAGPECRMMPEEASPSRDDEDEDDDALFVHRMTPGPGTDERKGRHLEDFLRLYTRTLSISVVSSYRPTDQMACLPACYI